MKFKSAVSRVVVAVICVVIAAAVAGAAYYATRLTPTSTPIPTVAPTSTPASTPMSVPTITPSPVTSSPASTPTPTSTQPPSPAPSPKLTEETVEGTSLTFEGMVEKYKHAKIVMKSSNSTTGETQISSFEYTATKETLKGQQVIKLELTYSEEESEETVASLWVTPDFQQIVQVRIGDNVLTGPYAETVGKQILQTLKHSPLFAVTSSYSIRFHVAEGSAEAMRHGWTVEAFHPIQVTISGITYPGYYFKVANVGDTDSDTQSVEGKIAELNPGFYYLVYIHAVQKNGDTFQLELTELTPAA
ncbi:hypothetical protein J7L06_09710 [Candidatus Bathyarchaeota archaeon]|nr:hypothetical protein [Candidatus Bathyarchaeota archaeon]